MTQTSPTIGSGKTGLEYRTLDNDGKKALLNHHKGAAAPTYAEAGMFWLDDAATPWLLKAHDGSDWITIAAINATGNTVTAYHGSAPLRLLNDATDTGSANAYAIAPTPAISAYAVGQIVTLKPSNNNTGASTLSVNALGTKNIKLLDGANLASGMIKTTGVYLLSYDGTSFVLLNPSPVSFGGDAGSGGSAGIVPAPAAGDAAAEKVLGAGGGWILQSGVPTGTILDYAGTSAPTGYLACDGAAVSRTTYASLFTAIGTSWGAGNGSTTFNLPNLARCTTIGSGGTGTGTIGNAVGNMGGAETHTLSIAEMPAHTHGTVFKNTGGFVKTDSLPYGLQGFGTTDTAGSGAAHNNMQPSAVVLKIIRH